MDNERIGAFIRMLRREKGLTQKDLAAALGITDRAVSKWERGLSAPDIALLEPLGKVLEISVTELLRGGRSTSKAEAEQQTQAVLDYSQRQLSRQVGAVRRRYLLVSAAMLLAVALICVVALWRGGWLCVEAQVPSPSGHRLTVYNRQMNSGFTLRRGTSFLLRYADGGSLRVNYGDCRFGGAWWSPDGTQLVLQLHYPEGTRLALLDDSHVNLNVLLATAVRQAGLVEKGCEEPDFRFLQWSADGSSLLIFYTCEGQSGTQSRGYFWFHVAQGYVEGVLRLESTS